MKILNIYHTTTGNTAKVADTISATIKELGHSVESVKVKKDLEIDLLQYDLIFAGSGVYQWLPGKPMIDFITKTRTRYVEKGEIVPCSPRRKDKKAVIYCTYGGVHTGINEAIPAVKFMGQLFDHLGIEVVDEWYVVGEYHPEKYKSFSTNGRLGNIVGRPDEHDLKEIAERVGGILKV